MNKILSNYILYNNPNNNYKDYTRYEIINGSIGDFSSSGIVARIQVLGENHHYSIVKNRDGYCCTNPASSFEEADRKLTELIIKNGYIILRDDLVLLLGDKSG